jgi:transglutaminase-like putative cysteine protease
LRALVKAGTKLEATDHVHPPAPLPFFASAVRAGLTIKDFVGNAIRKAEYKRYFVYDAFTNNCQRFVLDNLTSSPQVQVSPAVTQFVNQNAEQLLSRIPGYVQPVSHFLTSTANRTESVIRGY